MRLVAVLDLLVSIGRVASQRKLVDNYLEHSTNSERKICFLMPSAASTSSVAASADGAAAAASASEGGAAAPANAASPRLLNTTVCVPNAYGSIAIYLGNSADEYATHEWTLYVRGPNDEDLSAAVAKVVFSLHPSFPQPVRELTAPPFEVTEKGWGEFEASIRIVWRDPEEKATVVSCILLSNLMCAN